MTDTITLLNVAEYNFLVADLDVTETIMLEGAWPISVGLHADLGEILLGHIGDQAILIRAPRMLPTT